MKIINTLSLGLSLAVAHAYYCPTLKLGYPCCQYNNVIYYQDSDANWSIENGEWCGIWVEDQSYSNASCWSSIYGYPCCKNTKKIIETDQNGNWGIENGEWCGMEAKNQFNYDSSCWSSIYGYPCCKNTKKIIEIDQNGYWGIENNKWCGIDFKYTTTTTKKKTSTKANATKTKTAVNKSASSTTPFPKAQKSVVLKQTIIIKSGEVYDGLAINGVWTSYGRGLTGLGDCKNVEGWESDAVFRLESGATLKNVILGPDSVEHVHCVGDGCTVENVWWDDVCEDALSIKGTYNKNAKFYLIGGGARDGSDKIVQHNSAGTVYIKGFTVKNSGKLYRSCGNCKKNYQGERHVIIENVNASNVGVLAGINTNLGDTATFKNINANGGKVCDVYEGNNYGGEPKKIETKCKGKSDCVCK